MELTGSTFFFDWEVQLMVFLQQHLGTVGTAIASFFSMFGEQLVCVAVLGFLYWCFDKQFGEYVGINVLMANTLNPMVKNIFIRRRPYFDHPEIQCLKPVNTEADLYDISAQGYSFPSGHSSNAVTVFSSLSLYKKTKALIIIGIVIPFLVGVSRFCVGVHYPTDVLAGWLLGLCVILLMPFLRSKIRKDWIFYLVMVAMTVPGLFYCKSEDYFTSFGLLLGFVAGTLFEKKLVRFENTRSILRILLRMVGGVAIYFGLNTVLKLPFNKDFLDSGTFLSFMVRTIRYMIVTFVDIGVFPLVFRVGDKVFKK